MIDEFSRISELKSIIEQKSVLMRKEAELSKPLLTNLEYIPEIYNFFCEEYASCLTLKKETDTQFKRKFLFIILFLYSPNTLANNKKITNGVREEVAQVFGFRSPSGVSNLCPNAADWYGRYKDYQHDIDCLYGVIVSRLKAEGFIE